MVAALLHRHSSATSTLGTQRYDVQQTMRGGSARSQGSSKVAAGPVPKKRKGCFRRSIRTTALSATPKHRTVTGRDSSRGSDLGREPS